MKNVAKSIDQAFSMLKEQFNSYQHQAQARTYFSQQYIQAVKKEKDCSALISLETIHQRILDFSPSCGKYYQADTHCQYFLAKSVERERKKSKMLLQHIIFETIPRTDPRRKQLRK